jgi:hypothetical protein
MLIACLHGRIKSLGDSFKYYLPGFFFYLLGGMKNELVKKIIIAALF